MRKNYYVHLTSIGILLLLGCSQLARGQNSVLILKGNTVSPANAPAQTTQTTTPTPAKKATTTATQPSGSTTTTTKKTSQSTTTVTKTTTTQAKPVAAKAAPVQKTPAKPAPVVQAKPKPTPPPVVKASSKKNGKEKGAKKVDLVQRVTIIHNLIGNRFPQRTIDSFADANHDMLDSIRADISHHRDKDSISFLQTALANGVNDSVVIVTINNLLNAANVNDVVKSTGSINAYCIDLSTQAPMDSVKVSVFSHDSLVTTGFSGSDGFSKMGSLKPGEYSLSFAKNNYTPFSDRWVKVTADNVTYLEMPLTETPRFYLPRFSAEIWALIVVGVVSIFVLVYSIIRRLGRVA